MRSRVLVAAFALLLTTLGARGAHAEETKKAAPARAQKSEAADKGKADKSDKSAEAAPTESAPKGAPAATATTPATARESTSKSGEKMYEFGAVEVEGRLKAPQILYFVRRVRAELKSGQLGHRSFLPELRDTRRSEALR